MVEGCRSGNKRCSVGRTGLPALVRDHAPFSRTNGLCVRCGQTSFRHFGNCVRTCIGCKQTWWLNMHAEYVRGPYNSKEEYAVAHAVVWRGPYD